LGINLSTSRIGSAINGSTTPAAYNIDNNLGTAFLVGEILCIISFGFAILLCLLDKKADIEDGKDINKEVTEEEKFRLSDIKDFKLVYWIITINCVMMYGGIFPFIQNASGLL